MKKKKNKKVAHQLNDNQKNYLKKLKTLSPNFKIQGKLGEFFDLFLVCDATARQLINYSYTEKGQSKLGKKPYTIRMLKAAIKHFSLIINEQILKNIFDSDDKRKQGNKSCKQLRNEYIHNLLEEYRSEIENRIIDLKSDMEQWINLFR